ncbi:PAS domain-containing protein [Hwanghaeella grinnelliae]|uniref:PAS domain-containing protein n=1 Tax=Hwanghaeella grinnelliae TaxID=2500179 RepID=A0A3S3UR81_9PROT|nr:PAS domain-containing protein [Hwanghaeella grinnelliae]RVU38711.1 PAS domain-containing protein [Hwanghaeella grinnelliae]
MPPAESGETQPVSGAEKIATFLESRNVLRFFDYWRSKRTGRGLPSRRDIDPIEIPWALPWIFLMDYEVPETFRFRLAGQELVDVFGRRLKGSTLKDVLSDEVFPQVTERWLPLVNSRAAICMKGMVYEVKGRLPIGERIVLPLADEPDGPVTGLAGVTIFSWVPEGALPERKPAEVLTVPIDTIF